MIFLIRLSNRFKNKKFQDFLILRSQQFFQDILYFAGDVKNLTLENPMKLSPYNVDDLLSFLIGFEMNFHTIKHI